MRINDDGLDFLAAHHGAHTAARRQPGRSAIGVGKGNSGHQAQVLANRAADGEADLLAVLFKQQSRHLVVAFAQIGLGALKRNLTVLGDADDSPLGRCVVQCEAGNFELPEREAEAASRVGFLDTAGERTLAAHTEAIRVGKVGAGKGTGREDQRVLGRHGIDRGHAHVEQLSGNEVAAGANDRLALQFFGLDRLISQMDVEVLAHGGLPGRYSQCSVR